MSSPQPLLQQLKDALYGAVGESVPEKAVAVAFSGGVDSALLARICGDLGKQVLLVTVGFPGSHDIEFSQKIARAMGMPQQIVQIKVEDFAADLAHVRQVVPECSSNTSHIENCIAYFYISRAARDAGGLSTTVLSANGCDELFCGYNGYRAAFEKGEQAIMALTEDKIANELVLVQEISRVAGEFGVRVVQPFLTAKFVEFAKAIPVDQKMLGADDLVRKHVLRQVALLVGVPAESANKPKKALQYGSLIHKNFKKLR